MKISSQNCLPSFVFWVKPSPIGYRARFHPSPEMDEGILTRNYKIGKWLQDEGMG